MLPMNGIYSALRVRREEGGCGLGPALLGGWIGGSVLGALALWNGLGWLAALAFYSLAGAGFLLAIAVVPLMEIRLHQPVLRPVPVRVHRRS